MKPESAAPPLLAAVVAVGTGLVVAAGGEAGNVPAGGRVTVGTASLGETVETITLPSPGLSSPPQAARSVSIAMRPRMAAFRRRVLPPRSSGRSQDKVEPRNKETWGAEGRGSKADRRGRAVLL